MLKHKIIFCDIMSQTEGSPEQLGMYLFSKNPHELLQVNIGLPHGMQSIDYAQMLFRILFSALDYLSNGLNTMDLSILSTKTMYDMNPWFNLLGYEINCVELTEEDLVNLPLFCEIYLNKGTKANFFNIQKEMDSHYRIIYKANFEEDVEIEQYICIFKTDTTIFAINFTVKNIDNSNNDNH